MERELDVAAAGFDADLADDGDRRVAHLLILDVAQRLHRCDRDRVTGVYAHRIDVLDRADDDDVVGTIADHFELELLPADHAAVDEHLANRRLVDAATHGGLELVRVVRDATTGATERERRPDDRRITDLIRD